MGELKPIQASPPSLQRVPLHGEFISERGLFIMRVLIVLAALSVSVAFGQSFIAGQFSCPKEGRDGTYEDTRQCDKYYERYDGIAEERLCPDGLVSDPHPKHPDPSDCAKFYICLNGVTPREQGCELGLVYNENTQSCDSPKNVPECKDYYAFLEDEPQQQQQQQQQLQQRRPQQIQQ